MGGGQNEILMFSADASREISSKIFKAARLN